MNIKQLRKRLKKAGWIGEVGDVLREFLSQFTSLELRWIKTLIEYDLENILDGK